MGADLQAGTSCVGMNKLGGETGRMKPGFTETRGGRGVGHNWFETATIVSTNTKRPQKEILDPHNVNNQSLLSQKIP